MSKSACSNILSKPEKTFQVGDRVSFSQYWSGEVQTFHGVVLRMNDSNGTALVRYDDPDQVMSIAELQAPIGWFALSSPTDAPPEQPEEPSLLCSKDANGRELVVGDRVTAAWKAGKYVYYGIIESFSGKGNGKAHGRWREGRRDGDGDQFSVASDQLIKVPQEGVWSASPQVPPEAQTADLAIATLSTEITQIQTEGPIAPEGCWVEEYTATSGTSRHVRYNARQPIFEGKRSGGMVRKSAIGKKNSPAHQQAIEAIARRNRIQALKRQIQELEQQCR